MKIIERFKSKLFKRILKATGLCTACFIFEACYGAPEGEFDDVVNEQVFFNGWVKDNNTHLGIESISVKVKNLSSGQSMKTFTDDAGNYNISMSVFNSDEIEVTFMDVDSATNNLYEDKDTVVTINNDEYNNRGKEVNTFLKPQQP